jgi:Flp pilus assembly protein TadG
MRSHVRAAIRDEAGQTMTEFAIVLPILALLLFGVIQFGILFNNYITLTDATRAGARKAAVSRHLDDPSGDAEAQVRSSASGLDQDDLDVTISTPAGWERGADVTVEARYPYEIDLLGFSLADGFLSSSTTERVE